MDDAGLTVREGYIKQRRNLVAVSLALIFYHTSGLVLEKFQVFGNTFNVTDPWLASTVLWVAWGYFLLRYYQLFRDLGDKGIRSAFAEKLHSLVRRVAEQQLRKTYRSMDFGPSSHDLELKDLDMDSIRADSKCWVFRVSERKDGRTIRSQRPDPLEPPMLYVTGRRLRGARLRAVFHVAASTRLLTEYYLPFLVAAIPVVVVAWKKFLRSA